MTTDARPEYQLADQMAAESGRVAMSGVQAVIRVPLDQQRADTARGLSTATLICGYRGSPVGGIDISYHRHRELLEAHDVRFMNGVNEDLAATVIFGSQLANLEEGLRYDGVKGLWYGKGPGLDRSGDALRHANFSGVGRHGGVLAVAGDDAFCKSSTIPSGSEWALADLGMPILAPATVQEVLDLGRHGYELSRFSGAWIGFKLSTEVADAFATVDVDPSRLRFAEVHHEVDGKAWQPLQDHRLLAPMSIHLEEQVYVHRLEAAKAYARDNHLDRTSGARDAWIGIIAPGKPLTDVRGALERLGFATDADLEAAGIRLYQPALVWPLEPSGLRAFAEGLDEILVIEEKRAFVETQVKEILYGTSNAPRVIGKTDDRGMPLIPGSSGLDADRIVSAVRSRLLQRIPAERMAEPRTTIAVSPAPSGAPQRTPYFCSGCPHNRSTVVPAGSVAGGGIGCHAMALMMDGRAHGITQMGGEGAQWAGMEPFLDDTHRFQNLGDGTFAHSGSLAIRQSVAAGSNVTFKILHNGVVAMTGGQEAAGEMEVPALTRHLESEGVRRTVVLTNDLGHYGQSERFAANATLRHRDDLDEVQRELREVPGVTALVYDQGCAAELRRHRRRGTTETPTKRIMINEAVCDGCGHCGLISNCMSVHPVQTPFGRKTRIHQESCNYDYSCVDGNCPAFVTVEVDVNARTRRGSSAEVEVDGELPDASVPAAANLLLVGIGGTGVVTVNQVLGTAALLDGRHVHGLDQTGLSQKGGPVVSNLRISQEPIEGSNKIGACEADTVLLFDVVAGISPANLARASADRTVVVGSTSRLPTGRMVSHTAEESMPGFADLRATLDASTRQDDSLYFDAEGIARTVFASQPTANMIILGSAWQMGRLPVAATAIEQAIELNGVDVEMNVAAFRLGRQLAVDADLRTDLEAATRTRDQSAPGLTGVAADLAARVRATDRLAEVLAWRIPELIAYQDKAYAERYIEAVARVRAAEETLGAGDALSVNVATQLFKLMAYKDEYEVARLSLAADMEARAKARFGPGAKVTYMLKPPSLNRDQKIGFGSAIAKPMFKALAKGKGLRGRALDPFGRTKERTIERELIEDYVGLVERLLSGLTAERYDQAAKIAGLADQIRGFDEVKLGNVARYRAELQAALGSYGE